LENISVHDRKKTGLNRKAVAEKFPIRHKLLLVTAKTGNEKLRKYFESVY